ncbi:restriction endonuclease subunit S [Bacteroidales bacterium OttesenSCG-928-M06]|nr:restriction endonuclease subunit S [Bacteroidales bacterium OttesenSCG-928-M06]
MDTKKLRQKILDLAIRGKLVPQDPNDEPASVLIEKIRAEKERLIKEKKIKRDKNESYIYRSDKSYYEKFADGTVKCIDEEIPFEVPESWQWVRLGSITNYIQRGKSPKYSPVEKYPVLAQKCNQWDGISLEKALFIDPETITKYGEERFLLDGDIVINSTGTGTLGRVGLYKDSILGIFDRVVADSHITVVRCNTNVFHSYLYFFFRSAYQQKKLLDNAAGSTNQKELYVDTIRTFYCPVPPLKEQIRIVNLIEQYNAIIDFIEENQKGLSIAVKNVKSKILDLAIRGKLVPQDPNDEPASVLLERIKAEHPESKKKTKNISDNSHYTFSLPESWVWCRLEDVCGFENGFAFSSNDYKTIGIPLIRISNIIDGSIELNNCVYIDESEFIPQRYQIEKGDLLIAMSGATTGKMGIYKSIDPAYLNQRVGCIKSKNNQLLSNLYRNYFLLLQTDEILKLAHGGAQPNISSNKINSIEIPLPPINEQRRIVKRIEEIFASLDEIANSIKA